MMRRKDLTEMEKVTEALYQKEYSALRPTLEAEAKVMQQLARLDDQALQTRRNSARTDGYQVTGTDVLWNGWESSTRRNLNTELARIRSQKLSAMDRLRSAFGRKQAVQNLSDQAKKAAQSGGPKG